MFKIILHTYRLLLTKNVGSSCDSSIDNLFIEQSNAVYCRMNWEKKIKTHVNDNEYADSSRFMARSQNYSFHICYLIRFSLLLWGKKIKPMR